ncbi:hypothetical protein AYO44_01905 [Planctomycetaceae bacterium SCGC AG-212-F19]|nr:hypothetical protein AYO44_01905 [Planctomycetaceae bacterium SCGC AG-212-F19]
MRASPFGPHRWAAVLGSLTLLAVLAPSAWAENKLASYWPFKKKDCDVPPVTLPCPELVPGPVKEPEKKEPEKKEPEKKEPEKLPPVAQPPVIAPPVAEAPEMGPALGASGFSIASSNVGYIDPAIPYTGVRFRYDTAYDMTHPNRAEYFYAKYQSIGGNGVALAETRVDYEDWLVQLEYAWTRRFSTFIEAGARAINPELNNNAAGWTDTNAGFKYAFVANDDRFLTFQFRTYIPTGPGARGLGTNHVSLEPGLLLWQKLGDRTRVEAEFLDWIPVEGSDYAGNVLQYGIGISYDVFRNCKYRIAPVVEFVGWTVLAGQDTDFQLGIITTTTPPGINGPGGTVGSIGAVGTFNNPARGDTIVNVKGGVRFDVGSRLSIYAGYGHAITGDKWYRDLARLEVRWAY